MQIRVANRQDEPIIRTIVNQANAEHGLPEIELTGGDSDLNNIEAHYFWYDGIFVVAEEDGQIVGLAGARRGETDDVLELLRLVVIPSRRRHGTAQLLMNTIVFFARNAEYEEIRYAPQKHDGKPFLGFVEEGKVWKLDLRGQSVTSRCD